MHAATIDSKPRNWFTRRWRRVGMVAAVLLAGGGLWWQWTLPRPHSAVQICPGITYLCEDYDEPEISGLAHIVTVDLRTPRLRLYTTPLDAEATAAGWEYRTCWIPSAVRREKLVVGINGTLFQTDGPSWAVWPGVFARSFETIVANNQINHVDPYSFLLWFADDLTPRLELTRPPSPSAYQQALYGISGQLVVLDGGHVSEFAGHVADRRTLVGMDRRKKQLFLAVFENASMHRGADVLASHGAIDAIVLDGGDSTCLAFGPGVRGVSRRTIVYPGRAVATMFGVGFTESP